MEFRILGSMEVLDGPRRARLPAGRGRAVLAMLVLHAGEVVPADRLIDELWGEHPPPTASTALQGLVSKLRKQLGQATLETVGGGYRLAAQPDDVDALLFAKLLERAHSAVRDERSRLLTQALKLWRGPALADFTYEPFAQRDIAALEELRLAAVEDRIDADLDLGRTGLVAELEKLIPAHPFREKLHALLMLALYRDGRQAEALAAYRTARETLAEEMGIDLGPALRELHERILRQDPSLSVPNVPAGLGTWIPGERHIALSLALAEVHLVLGRFVEAQAMLRNVIEGDDAFASHAARLEHARIQFILGPDPMPLSAIEQEARVGAEFFAEDDAGSARASFLLGCVRMRQGRMTEATAAFDESLSRAERAGHSRERLAARWMIGEMLVSGPVPVRDALARIDRLESGEAGASPGLLAHRAVLSAMEGRFDDARALVEQAREIATVEMKAPRLLVFIEAAAASVALLAGDLESATRAMQARLDIALKGEERENIAQAAGWLSLLHRRSGHNDEAAQLAALSAERAPHGVPGRAISLAAAGDAHAAVALIPEQMPNLRGDMLLEEAIERRDRGDEAGAKEAEAEAAHLYRSKGNVISAERLMPTAWGPT